jgi:hypothetical protein
MAEDLDKLEREVESQLAAVGGRLSVELPVALMLRVKAGVRHELNEGWLASHPQPRPSTEALERVRSAVREALARPAVTAAQSSWGRAAAAMAAAAMIALSVGLIHRAGTLKPAPTGLDEDTRSHLELFTAAAEAVFSSEPLTASIDSDLSSVEEHIAQWQATSQDDTESLNSILNEIDKKLAEPEKGKGVSTIHQQVQGAFG